MGFIKNLQNEVSEIVSNCIKNLNEIKDGSPLYFLAMCISFIGGLILFGCLIYNMLPAISAIITLNPLPNEYPQNNSLVNALFILGMILVVLPFIPVMMLKGPGHYNLHTQKKSESLDVRDRVFIVHGHDEDLKNEVASFLGTIKIDPIILKNVPNKGTQWILDKLEENSAVNFAIVLYTPDDLGKEKNEPDLEPRVRPNVNFELGFFLGKLWKNRVCIIFKGFSKLPSDLEGTMRVDYNDPDGWRVVLMRDLASAKIRFTL